MERILDLMLNALFPKRASTLALEELVEHGLLRSLEPAAETPHSFIHALFHYKNPTVRSLVWEIKYGANTKIITEVAEIFAEEIHSFFEEHHGFISREWIIVPIPSSRTHRKQKGFNQTEKLAQAIMKTHIGNSVSYEPYVLIKTKETKPQTSIKHRSERLSNIIGSFGVQQNNSVVGKNIIIIDDVTTTGSTFVEARKVLKDSGAKHVIGFAIAH